MPLFASRFRRPLNSALALLVAAALSHCSWQESRELAQWTRTLAQHRLALPSPVQAPIHDCDHEYGCICRGATIVHAIDVTHCQAACGELLPIDLGTTVAFSASDDAASVLASSLDDDSSVPPLSGRQLRARYASLVI